MGKRNILATRNITLVTNPAEKSKSSLFGSPRSHQTEVPPFPQGPTNVCTRGTGKLTGEHMLQECPSHCTRCSENKCGQCLYQFTRSFMGNYTSSSWPPTTSKVYKSTSENDRRRRIHYIPLVSPCHNRINKYFVLTTVTLFNPRYIYQPSNPH